MNPQSVRPRTTGNARLRTRSQTWLAHLLGMSESRETPLDKAPMWTLDDLCRKLRCSPETVYTWRKQGIAPRAYKIGKHLLFEDADVRAWLKRHVSEAGRPTDSGDEPGGSKWGW